jgi:hypothetical protein
VSASACTRALSPVQAAWLELLASTASNDVKRMSESGKFLFQNQATGLGADQMLEALVATLGALIANGEREEATALFNAYVPALSNPGRFALVLNALQGMLASPR